MQQFESNDADLASKDDKDEEDNVHTSCVHTSASAEEEMEKNMKAIGEL